MNPSSFFLELYEPLPERIQIGRCEYPTIEICRVLECITNEAIIKKGTNTLRNGFRNCTIQIKVLLPTRPGERLKVIGKGRTYELTSTW